MIKDKVATFRGTVLQYMSKEELIEAIHILGNMEREERERANKYQLKAFNNLFRGNY